MRIGIDIDFTLSAVPDFFRYMINCFRNDSEIIVLTSMVAEIGDRKENFKYRLKQLKKLNLEYTFDYMLIAGNDESIEPDLESLGEAKKDLCSKFGIDVLFDDEDIFVEKCSEVTDVFKLVRKRYEH